MKYYSFVTAAITAVAVAHALRDSVAACESDAGIAKGEALPDAVNACQALVSPRVGDNADIISSSSSTLSDLTPVFTIGSPTSTITTSTSSMTTTATTTSTSTSEANGTSTSTTFSPGGFSATIILPDPISTIAASGSTRVWWSLIGMTIPVSVVLAMN